MAAYKMATVKVTPPNDFPLGLIRSHMVVINLFLMLCDLQRVVRDLVRDLCPTLYIPNHEATEIPAADIPKLDLLHASYCVSNGHMSSTSDMFIWVWKHPFP
jgi:hypothetical protein